MSDQSVHFSSETVEHSTPQGFFDKLDAIYNFTLDPCATPQNRKCKRFFTKEQDGLTKSWANEVVFMNPPYGDPEQPCKLVVVYGRDAQMPIRNAQGAQVGYTSCYCSKKKCAKRGYHVAAYIPGLIDWMRKAYESAKHEGATVVCLIPSRTDTVWFHTFAVKGKIEFIKGRLKFGDAKSSAPFPSALVVFKPRGRK